MPKFSTHVALMSPEYQAVSFRPGDEVPEWAVDQVGAHVLEPEETPADEPDESDESDEHDGQDQDEDGEGDAEGGGDGQDDTPPPADDQPDFTAPAPARRGRSRKQ